MLGPTASGKSETAIRLAEEMAAEIISVDSMQVYRRMDIGTAKPDREDRARVRHHGIDLVDPSESFSVADFQRMGRSVMESATRPLIIVGGSGLHFRALVDPMQFRPHDAETRTRLEDLSEQEGMARLRRLDPEAGDHIDLSNPRRVTRALEIAALTGETPSERAATEEQRRLIEYEPLYSFKAIAFDPGEKLPDRVVGRLDSMLAEGLEAEVARLANDLGRTARQAVGYKQLLPVVAGELSLREGVESARRATLALAKRQRTFFRRDPRLTWLPWSENSEERWQMAVQAMRG